MFSDKKGSVTRKKALKLDPAQTIALVFLGIILLGTILLALPVASRNGESCGLLGALFTATSATCVTGLVMFDTWSQFSGFGQGVILGLIEIGGLGFMSAAAIVVFLLRKKVGLKQRMLIAQSLSLNEMEGAQKLQKYVIFGSLSIQLVGAVILFIHFLPRYGVATAAWWGVFHSISAFCNAGFDVLGSIAPGASMITFNDDPVVCITLMALVVIGGLGFFVWEELVRLHSWKKFSVYTKLVLLVSFGLILAGAVLVCLLEWNNPLTMGEMSVPQKILNGFFQSVTLRTAGFVSMDQGALTDASKGVSLMLMMVGGSSGSTAGGAKTVTLVVLLLFMWSRARGRQTVTVFKRSIPTEKVLDAVTIVSILVALSMFGAVFISATSGVSFIDSLYESVSALATVGLTAGITGKLSVAAKILIIIYMYFGRVGVLTISLGFLMGDKAQERFRYAYTNLLIG